MRIIFVITLIGLLIFSTGCSNKKFSVEVKANMEEKSKAGKLYTPSTQSFLRGHHWLENIKKANFTYNEDKKGDVDFETSDASRFVKLKNIPLKHLVPRLHYKVAEKPDDFDLFNLMLAEYSRNGISFPIGRDGDEITHFQTNLEVVIPWTLEGDYNFKPNPIFKPLRLSIVNNCLQPGLWEFNAVDKTGEIYHSWFNFPKDDYYDLVATTNGVEKGDAEKALSWKKEGVELDLDRLRKVTKKVGKSNISVVDEEISYSTQGSRQKLSSGFVTYKKDEDYVAPMLLSHLINNKVKMSRFIPPGLYSQKNKMDFDFSEFGKPISAEINVVDPLTSFNFNEEYKRDGLKYIEMTINLPNKRKLIVGNIPMNLLSKQEDFTLNGFGVGILSASDFAERRPFLIKHGYHPSYAYLVKEEGGKQIAMNSHEEGLEQIFIRCYPDAEVPVWDVVFTSYERITDIVKYRIEISPELVKEQQRFSKNYTTPIYFSYRDDNIR